MQITFDTTNPHDLTLLNRLLDLALPQSAQPAVAQNTGTIASGVSSLSPEGSGVSEQGAADAAPAAPDTKDREKKERKPRAKKEEVAAEPVEKFAESAGEAADSSPSADAASVSAAQSDPATFTLDEVRAALQQFTAAKGVPAGIELLKKFNAGRISELAENDYASFVAECSL